MEIKKNIYKNKSHYIWILITPVTKNIKLHKMCLNISYCTPIYWNTNGGQTIGNIIQYFNNIKIKI